MFLLPVTLLLLLPTASANNDSSTGTSGNQLPSWESKACMFFFGETRPHDAPVLSNECFGLQQKDLDPGSRAAREARISALQQRSTTWPPKNRRPVSDLAAVIAAMNYTNNSLPKVRCSDKKWVPRDDVATLLIDVARRVIYVKNWKAASTLIFQKLSSSSSFFSWSRNDRRGRKAQRLWNDACREIDEKRGSTTPFALNSTVMSIQDRDTKTIHSSPWLEPNDCMERTPHGRDEIASSEIGDAIWNNYFVFSFVRDPFTRIESSFAQVPFPLGFDDLLSGASNPPLYKNPHYWDQIRVLTRRRKTGKRLRVDFVGHVESFDLDWWRLAPALDASQRHLTPVERLQLVRPSPLKPFVDLNSIAKDNDTRTEGTDGSDRFHERDATSGDSSSSLKGALESTERTNTTKSSQLGKSTEFIEGGERSEHLHVTRKRQQAAEFVPQPPGILGKKVMPMRWNRLHEIYVCRRYIQDHFCFGYDIPETCIEHADLTLGMVQA